MSRGKYSARAANREAARDNELIAAKLVEITDLKAQLAKAKADLAEERHQRGLLITSRANELSDEQIAYVRSMAQAERVRHTKGNLEFADWLVDLFNLLLDDNPDLAILPCDYAERFALLVGNDRVGEYVGKIVFDRQGINNRRRRRITPQDVRRLSEEHLQDMNFNNIDPLLTKAGRGVKEGLKKLYPTPVDMP